VFGGRDWETMFPKRGTNKTRPPNTQFNAVWETIWGDATENALNLGYMVWLHGVKVFARRSHHHTARCVSKSWTYDLMGTYQVQTKQVLKIWKWHPKLLDFTPTVEINSLHPTSYVLQINPWNPKKLLCHAHSIRSLSLLGDGGQSESKTWRSRSSGGAISPLSFDSASPTPPHTDPALLQFDADAADVRLSMPVRLQLLIKQLQLQPWLLLFEFCVAPTNPDLSWLAFIRTNLFLYFDPVDIVERFVCSCEIWYKVHLVFSQKKVHLVFNA
jgi:hypothetical protein